MKKILLMSPIVLCAQVSLAAVKLNMKLNINNQINRSSVITQFDKAATITQTNNQNNEGLEITATPYRVERSDPQAKEAIRMAFVISHVNGAERTVLAKPQVTALIGHEVKFTQQANDGTKLELTVTPTLQ